MASFVNTAEAGWTGGTTIALPATSLSAGNLIVVAVGGDGGKDVSSISDTAGNSYTRAGSRITIDDGTSIQWTTIFYCLNASANGSNVVTVTLTSSSVSWAHATSVQYSGLGSTGTLSTTASGTTSNGSSVTSGSFTVNDTNNVVVAAAACNTAGAYTAGTNYTLRSGVNSFDKQGTEDRVNSSTGSQTATLTHAASAYSALIVAVFAVPIKTISGSPQAKFTLSGDFFQTVVTSGSLATAFSLSGALVIPKLFDAGTLAFAFTSSAALAQIVTKLLEGTCAIHTTVDGPLVIGARFPFFKWGLRNDVHRGRLQDLVYVGIENLSQPVRIFPGPGIYTEKALAFGLSGTPIAKQPVKEEDGRITITLAGFGQLLVQSTLNISGQPVSRFALQGTPTVIINQLTIGDYDLPTHQNAITPMAVAFPTYDGNVPVNTSFVDQPFRTRIIRVSGTPGDVIPNTGGATWRTNDPYGGAGSVYDKHAAWNANQTILMLKHGATMPNGWQAAITFLDGSTYVPLYVRADVKTEYRWHPTDPRYLLWVDSAGNCGRYDVAADSYTTLFTAPGGYTTCDFGSYEGNPSLDGRWMVVQGIKNGAPVCFAVDLQTGAKYPDIFPLSPPYNFNNLDWASISPSGTYIVISQDSQSQRVLDKNGNIVTAWTYQDHYDLGYDKSGNEVAFSFGNWDTQSPAFRRLSDGNLVTLPFPFAPVDRHSSTKNYNERGWGYGHSSYSTTGVLAGELVAMELTAASPRMRRICKHRASSDSNQLYERLPFAPPSPDGLRMLFSSDWGNTGNPSAAFVVDVRECPLLPPPPPPPSTYTLPADRATTWNPGLMSDGGIPSASWPIYTTLTANGTDDTTQINNAIAACPVGQVVKLNAGAWKVTGVILINKGIVVRGVGPNDTIITKTNGVTMGSYTPASNDPIFVIGPQRYPAADPLTSKNLTVDGAKGATSVTVSDGSGFAPGQIVVLDELSGATFQTDPLGRGQILASPDFRVSWQLHNPAQGWDDPLIATTPVSGDAASWFCRQDRPTGEMKEVASVSGNLVTFTTPLHISYRVSHTAQLTRYTGTSVHVKNAGVEDLKVVGGSDGAIRFMAATKCWAKNIDNTIWLGEAFALNHSFRCEIRGCYVHDGAWSEPGGGGYAFSHAFSTAETLVEDNIIIMANKVMVSRCAGAGSVYGYNYCDDGFIRSNGNWVEVGLNASHMSGPHHSLFEGNYAWNFDSDHTHGNAIYHTVFRNWLIGYRKPFVNPADGLTYDDLTQGNNGVKRCAGALAYSYWMSFVGNVLGRQGQMNTTTNNFSYNLQGSSQIFGKSIFMLGWDENAPYPYDANVEARTIRDGNWDWLQGVQSWHNSSPATLPASMYLSSAPSYFGANVWPWVDPSSGNTYTLPAKQRYDSGNFF